MDVVDDIEGVFSAGLNKMKKMAGEANYSACSPVTNDITAIPIRFGHKSGILVGEASGDVFGGVSFTMDERKVGIASRNGVKEKLRHELDDVLKSFSAGNTNDLFNTLTNIRGTAGKFFITALNFHITKQKLPETRE